MSERFIKLGPAATAALTDALVSRIKAIGVRARNRQLLECERKEIVKLTQEWEGAQIACLAFIEAEAFLIQCRLRGRRI